MTDTVIRRLAGEEQREAMHRLSAYAFFPSPPFVSREAWFETVYMREGAACLALFEDGALASAAAATPMIQNVRGRLFAAHGVWAVATEPMARQCGYSRRVMAALLADGRAAGHVFSTLYPFHESFYERLGYVTFPQPRLASFTPAALAPLTKRDLGGRVELALYNDSFDAYQADLARTRLRTHGMAFFKHGDGVAAGRNSFWLARAIVGDEASAVMLYALEGENGRFLLHAPRFYYDTAQGRYLLLQWIARHVHQVERVELLLAPGERPETWFADLGVKVEGEGHTPMGRVLDVALTGGMTVGPGCFTARIVDRLCPWNEAIWEFVSADGTLRVAPGERAGCNLTIEGLSALLYGTHDPDDFALRGWGDPEPAEQAAMRAMFPLLQPHLHERF